MSMTLILWKAPLVADEDQGKALIAPWYESEDDSAFEPSDDIARVADELRRRWPYRALSNEETVDRMPEEERRHYSPEALKEIRGFDEPEGSPWADLPFWQSDRLLAVDIRWGADDAVVTAIFALARKCELVLYDPQGPDVFLPTDPLPADEPDPQPTFMDWVKISALCAVLLAVTYAAWLIPIGWIRWPAVAVAGFVAAAGLFVLGAMIAAAVGLIDINEGRRATCAEDEPPL
ncbi:MAG TPA: hypothetical protein VFZ35_05565 [Sphingomicrobium sp.]